MAHGSDEGADVFVMPEMPEYLNDWPLSPDDAPWPTVDELIEELEAVKAEAARAAEAATAREARLRQAPTTSEPEDWWRCDEAGLLLRLEDARRSLAVAQGRWLEVLAEVERREATVVEHHMPTASWLAAGPSHTSRGARAEVRLAARIANCPQVAAALRIGGMSVDQARAIVQGLERLPDDLDHAQRAAVERDLVVYAGEHNPDALSRLVNRAVEAAAPEVADDFERRALERAERQQQATRQIAWKTDPEDGSLRFWGKLPALEGELFRQHLSALASAQRVADGLMGVDTTQAQALADALALAVGHHATCVGGPARGGDHTRVVVTMDVDKLTTGIGVGTLVEGDGTITAAEARRLACTAKIVPMVLNSDSVPLDQGRSQRCFTPQQRLAMAVRDGGCAFPGCDRPPADCEAHHAVTTWLEGGRTNVDEGVLLCPHHHHLVEPDVSRPPEGNWKITYDERGKPVFHTPVDRRGERVTRQHHCFRW